jgi:hypothetical protein
MTANSLLGAIPGKQQFFDTLPVPGPLLDLVEVASVGVAERRSSGD